MREPLTVAVAQPPCVSYDVAANALTHAASVGSAGARVVVFPELSLTGYELDAPAIDGWRLGLAICKDTGIPRHASDTAALGIDAYVAGVLESADDAALQDERARRVATGHRVWVAVAGFAGSTGGGFARAAGRSAIWTSGGVAIARAGPEPGAIARATLG